MAEATPCSAVSEGRAPAAAAVGFDITFASRRRTPLPPQDRCSRLRHNVRFSSSSAWTTATSSIAVAVLGGSRPRSPEGRGPARSRFPLSPTSAVLRPWRRLPWGELVGGVPSSSAAFCGRSGATSIRLILLISALVRKIPVLSRMFAANSDACGLSRMRISPSTMVRNAVPAPTSPGLSKASG